MLWWDSATGARKLTVYEDDASEWFYAGHADAADLIACLSANPEAAGQVLLALESQYIAGEVSKFAARAEQAERELAEARRERDEALKRLTERDADLSRAQEVLAAHAGRAMTAEELATEVVGLLARIRELDERLNTVHAKACAFRRERDEARAELAKMTEDRDELRELRILDADNCPHCGEREKLRSRIAKLEAVVGEMRHHRAWLEDQCRSVGNASERRKGHCEAYKVTLRWIEEQLRALDEQDSSPHTGTTGADGVPGDREVASAEAKSGELHRTVSPEKSEPGTPEEPTGATRGCDARYVTRAELVEALRYVARVEQGWAGQLADALAGSGGK